MLTLETIQQFKDSGFGWLSPNGEIVVCSLFEHFTILYQFEDISKEVQEYDNICRDNFEDMTNSLEALQPDEHPEMHRFDGMNDSARFNLMKALYEKGYRRLGSSRDRNRNILWCSAEGYANLSKKQQKVLSELETMIGQDIRHEIVEVVKDGSHEYFKNIKY